MKKQKSETQAGDCISKASLLHNWESLDRSLQPMRISCLCKFSKNILHILTFERQKPSRGTAIMMGNQLMLLHSYNV